MSEHPEAGTLSRRLWILAAVLHGIKFVNCYDLENQRMRYVEFEGGPLAPSERARCEDVQHHAAYMLWRIVAAIDNRNGIGRPFDADDKKRFERYGPVVWLDQTLEARREAIETYSLALSDFLRREGGPAFIFTDRSLESWADSIERSRELLQLVIADEARDEARRLKPYSGPKGIGLPPHRVGRVPIFQLAATGQLATCQHKPLPVDDYWYCENLYFFRNING